MTGEMAWGAEVGVGCCSQRDTRGKRRYDGKGGAGVTDPGAGVMVGGEDRDVGGRTARYPRQARV